MPAFQVHQCDWQKSDWHESASEVWDRQWAPRWKKRCAVKHGPTYSSKAAMPTRLERGALMQEGGPRTWRTQPLP